MLIVPDTYDPNEETHELGITAGDLYAACGSTPLIYLNWDANGDGSAISVYRLYAYGIYEGTYYFSFDGGLDRFDVAAQSADDYPSTPHSD